MSHTEISSGRSARTISSLITVFRPEAERPILGLHDLYCYETTINVSNDAKSLEEVPNPLTSEETKTETSSIEEHQPTALPEVDAHQDSITPGLPASHLLEEKELHKSENEVVLIDDHATHFRVIRHIPNSGFYLIQFGPFQSKARHLDLQEYKPPPCRQDFIEFPYGYGLTCVRFAMPASSLPLSFTPSQPGVFAFLYTSQKGSNNVVGIRDHSRSPTADIHLFLSETKGKERVTFDVGGGKLCRDSGVTVLGIFWIASISLLHVDDDSPLLLTVITDEGFRVIQYDGVTARIVQRESGLGPISNAWWEEISHYIILEVSSGQLQPYVFRWQTLKYVSLPTIDLVLPRWRRLLPSDVSLMKVYNSTFCLHADAANGIISIRNLTRATEFDLVLDLQGPGQLRLQRVDNIIVIHRPDRAETHLFDLKNPLFHWEMAHRLFGYSPVSAIDMSVGDSICLQTVEALAPPVRLSDRQGGLFEPRASPVQPLRLRPFDSTHYPDNWDFRSVNGLVVDPSKAKIRKLELNLSAASVALIKRGASTVVRFLVQRKCATTPLLELLRFETSTSSSCLVSILNCLAQVYREAIDKISSADVSDGTTTPPTSISSRGRLYYCAKTSTSPELTQQPPPCKYDWVTASLADLSNYQQACGCTIFTERDLVTKKFDLPAKLSLFDIALRTPLHELVRKQDVEETKTSMMNVSTDLSTHQLAVANVKSLLNSLLNYVSALLRKSILPHRILRTFLFDLSVFAEQDQLLQQLFQFHIVNDCPDTLARLLRLWRCRRDVWAGQMVLDLSVRLGNWDTVVDLLIERKEYLRAVEIIRQHELYAYPIHDILSTLSEDVESQQLDPELLSSVLASLRHWIQTRAITLQLRRGMAINENYDWRTHIGGPTFAEDFPNIVVSITIYAASVYQTFLHLRIVRSGSQT